MCLLKVSPPSPHNPDFSLPMQRARKLQRCGVLRNERNEQYTSRTRGKRRRASLSLSLSLSLSSSLVPGRGEHDVNKPISSKPPPGPAIIYTLARARAENTYEQHAGELRSSALPLPPSSFRPPLGLLFSVLFLLNSRLRGIADETAKAAPHNRRSGRGRKTREGRPPARGRPSLSPR